MDILAVVVGYIMVASGVFLVVTAMSSLVKATHKEIALIPIAIWIGVVAALIVCCFFVDISVG